MERTGGNEQVFLLDFDTVSDVYTNILRVDLLLMNPQAFTQWAWNKKDIPSMWITNTSIDDLLKKWTQESINKVNQIIHAEIER